MGGTRVAVALLALLALASAQAEECKGVQVPQHVQVQGTTLTLNGLGLRQATFLKVSVYVASLYVSMPATRAETVLEEAPPKQLTLQFVRRVGVKDLRERFDEGFAQNLSPAELASLQDRITALKASLRDVRSGDRMTYTWLLDQSVQFEFNGKPEGHFTGADFGRALLGIWLGSHPADTGLKAGLLGGHCG
jgi:Chalcone isomerase-like